MTPRPRRRRDPGATPQPVASIELRPLCLTFVGHDVCSRTRMPKGSSKSTAQIQRLLEERRQYEAWLARLSAAADATPDQVRGRVRADYEARLEAGIGKVEGDAASARPGNGQKEDHRPRPPGKGTSAPQKMTGTQPRHAGGGNCE